MRRDPDYLYRLLPQVYRTRDAEQGEALRALLRVVNEQVGVIEDDIARLYANWFIETCDEWVVPYIGDLVGYQPAPGAGTAGPVSARREVANTIALRRRKGTLALLENLAGDVAGWPARAVQFHTLLGWTQHLNHLRPGRGRTTDLRQGDALDRIDGPFDELAHTIGLRGRYNIGDVGLFVWRLKAYSVTHTRARCIKVANGYGGCYTFSELGNDTPLHARAIAETDPGQIAQELNLPAPIRRRAFTRRMDDGSAQASGAYYGEHASLLITVQDWTCRGERRALHASEIIPADLADWQAYQAPDGAVLVDPELGRIVFPPHQLPGRVWVSYHYGFSADMGGGEYPRTLSQPAGARVYRVRKHPAQGEFATVTEALAQWALDKQDPARPLAAVVEIADSGVYHEAPVFQLDAGENLQLRAASMARPILRLLDYHGDKPDQISISGGAASRFTLDGILVAGCGLLVERARPGAQCGDGHGDLCDVTIRHCTLVPGWELDCGCEPKWSTEPSITVRHSRASIRVEHSISGPIRVLGEPATGDPLALSVSDSIIDALHPEGLAIADERCGAAFVTLDCARSTLIGVVQAHAVGLVENAIFTGALLAARRQVGCVRFSYVPEGSRTPRRFHCQPDMVRQGAPGESGAERVRPRFASLRYGTPAYCQLALDCAAEITRGADDESEMGAFHQLYQPQRAATLAARLDEYTPAGMRAGVIYAS